MTITNEIYQINGALWLVKEARSRADALAAIDHARATGSVGCTDTIDQTALGGTVEVVAEVVRFQDDTDRWPYE